MPKLALPIVGLDEYFRMGHATFLADQLYFEIVKQNISYLKHFKNKQCKNLRMENSHVLEYIHIWLLHYR